MMVKKVVTFLLVVVILQMTMAKTSDLVLQNGLNNYDGCSDAYVHGDEPKVNYGAVTNIKMIDEIYTDC